MGGFCELVVCCEFLSVHKEGKPSSAKSSGKVKSRGWKACCPGTVTGQCHSKSWDTATHTSQACSPPAFFPLKYGRNLWGRRLVQQFSCCLGWLQLVLECLALCHVQLPANESLGGDGSSPSLPLRDQNWGPGASQVPSWASPGCCGVLGSEQRGRFLSASFSCCSEF